MPEVRGRVDPAHVDPACVHILGGRPAPCEGDGDMERGRVGGGRRHEGRRHANRVAGPALDEADGDRARERLWREQDVELVIVVDRKAPVRVRLHARVRDRVHDDRPPALEHVRDEPGVAVDIQVGGGDAHGRRPRTRHRPHLVAHRGERAGRMDLRAVMVDPADVRRVAAVEDPGAIDPDPVSLVRPRPLRERPLGVRTGLAREGPDLPLDLDRVRGAVAVLVLRDVGQDPVLAWVEGDVRVLIVRVVGRGEVRRRDPALHRHPGRVAELIRGIDPHPTGLGNVEPEQPEEVEAEDRVAAPGRPIDGRRRPWSTAPLRTEAGRQPRRGCASRTGEHSIENAHHHHSCQRRRTKLSNARNFRRTFPLGAPASA